MSNLRSQISNFQLRLKPYTDVIIFMVTLLVANYAWKWTMVGDENGDSVTWFGMDITAPFEFMACHIASVVYWLVSLFRDTAYMTDEHTIRFASGTGTTIIWGCTALKQSFIWLCLILTVKSSTVTSGEALWLKKLWFIPFGWILSLILFLFGIVITLTSSQEVLTVLYCVPDLDILLSGVDAAGHLVPASIDSNKINHLC